MRQVASSLLRPNSRMAQTPIEGLDQIVRALGARNLSRRADVAEFGTTPANAPSAEKGSVARIAGALSGGSGADQLTGGQAGDTLTMAPSPGTIQSMSPSYGFSPQQANVASVPVEGVIDDPYMDAAQMPSPRDFERQGAGIEEKVRDGEKRQFGQGIRDREALGDAGLNVSESRSLGWASRMMQAEEVLRRLEQQGTRTGQRALEMIPGQTIENLLFDDEYRQYLQAENAFLNAALRSDTGAQINESEIPRLRTELMPRPGDDQETLAQRRRAREAFLLAIIAGSGEGAALLPDIGAPIVPTNDGASPVDQEGGTPRPTHRFNPETGQLEAIR